MPTVTNSDIIELLSNTAADSSFIQTLKIKYRPLVCPLNELLDYVDKDDSVYDIGCGSGQFAILVANFTDAKTIKGIEIDKHLVRNANQLSKQFGNGKKMSFSYFSGSQIPKDISNYSLIYMIDVYHHIPRETRKDFMMQVYEKMKPGARLVFKDIDGASPLAPFNILHDLIFAQELSHAISFNKAGQLITSLGLKILKSGTTRTFVYPHYFIVAKKQ